MQQHCRTYFLAFMVMTMALPAFTGCSEKDIPPVVDADEVIRFIQEAYEGQLLFRTDGFINNDTFSVPWDSAVFRDSLLEHVRTFDVYMVPYSDENALVDWDLGRLVREALVRVTDQYEIETTRQYSQSSIVDTSSRALMRYAFFLKLGNDAQAYLGWLLWGISGIGDDYPQSNIIIERYDGTSFRGDLSLYRDQPRTRSNAVPKIPFVRLSDLDTVIAGSRLVVNTLKYASAEVNPCHVVSGLGRDGLFTHGMITNSDTSQVDTLRVPRNEADRWNIFFMQEFIADTANPDEPHFTTCWCVPYRF